MHSFGARRKACIISDQGCGGERTFPALDRGEGGSHGAYRERAEEWMERYEIMLHDS